MEVRPRIGIPLGLDRGALRRGRETAYLDSAYPAAVAEAGGTPALLPIPAGPERALDGIDGLLLPGGDDFPPPTRYPVGVAFAPAPEAQRSFDAALLEQALMRGLPVLGICYGMQLMALQAGGSLIYDLPTERPDGIDHGAPGDASHPISLEPGSRLAALLGAGEHRVNSRHHQAVESPGTGLIVSARGPDGSVEAIESPGPGFAIGVQWHPEDLEGPARTRLFDAFVAACGARGREATA